jgi:hypothetical protein
MPGVLTALGTGTSSRTPTAYAQGAPSLLPLAVAVGNTSGLWMFALVSWRQDAGFTGTLGYPSTITVSDDANNFWIPVQTGLAASGITRCAIWMAPAARACHYVFISPVATTPGDAYQSALTAEIVEVTADCPWYSVAASTAVYTNQGTSVTASVDPGTSGLFWMGIIARDSLSGTDAGSNSGWSSITALSDLTTSNGTDHTGDMQQFGYYGSTGSGTCTLADTVTGATSDLAEVIIVVHGVTDVLAFPYAQPLENWPVLITEIAAGPALNLNPDIAQGTFDWTVQGGTLAAVNWPAWQPWPNYQALVTQSLQLTPSGSAAQMNTVSGLQPVSTSVLYTGLAWVYSVAGYSGTVQVRINWYTSGQSFLADAQGITVSPIPAGSWTQLTFAEGFRPPPTAAYGAAVVIEAATSGNVPASAVLYVGYNNFGPADDYENTPPDEVQWTDLSSRNFTQGTIDISRGIQYEQQALEAGTMTVTLANNDGDVTYGNVLSPYYPNLGDTDVPIRLRAVWPLSITPYYVLHSGYTDEIKFGWDSRTWYGFAAIESSDAWSRLTAQMLGAAEQEVLLDNPVAYISCNGSGANLAVNGTGQAQIYDSPVGTGTQTASFTSSAISLAGDQGVSCWQSTGVGNELLDLQGLALGFFPPAYFSCADGMTLEFWMSPQSVSASQPTFEYLIVATAFTGKGPAWSISINNLSGASGSKAIITTYDQYTGTGTSSAAFGQEFLTTGSAAGDWFFCVTWTQTTLSVVMNPGGGEQANVGPITVNFGPDIIGFTFGGNVGPNVNSISAANLPGFMNIAIYGIAVFEYVVPNARLNAHFTTALTANPLELDTSRLARVAGYAGATPVVLGMRGLDLGYSLSSDHDLVTPATDTDSQVASDYFTNIAASTLAFLYVNGPGTLIYQRRLDMYDKALSGAASGNANWGSGTWALGDNPALTLVPAPPTGWTTVNGATLTSGSLPSVSALLESAAVFHGNGSTASPQAFYNNGGAGIPVTPGNWMTLSCIIASPQGWAAGVLVQLQFYTSGLVFISSDTSPTAPLAASSLTYLQIAGASITGGGAATIYARVPATAAYCAVTVEATGTPASTVLFYFADVQLTVVPAALTSAPYGTAPEVPYLVGVELSSDRAQLYNQAILTQYGTNLNTVFTGSDVTFVPSSGVIVTITNEPSVALRSSVPYQVSVYLDNTVQALPYYIYEPAIEDFGYWIVNTLGSPLFRPDKITITPAATPQAMLMALQAEVGDTVTFRRRALGSAEIQIVTYISKLTHSIQIATGAWTAEFELSPFPQGNVLACDDPAHGTLTGGNYFGW